MRALIVGGSTNPKHHIAGFNLGYGLAFKELGWEVDSVSQAGARKFRGSGYDLFLLRDTMINVDTALRLKNGSKHFAIFTHSEYRQSRREQEFMKAVKPEHIFLDQPLGAQGFSELGIPSTFLGYGANPMCRVSGEKDIDVLWVGHGYAGRQTSVENQVWPLLDLDGFNVKVHGSGQPHGPLSIPDMYEAMSRSRIVIHMCGYGALRWGYGGRRIFDALASGAMVISDSFPECWRVFPKGVSFVKSEDVHVYTRSILESDKEFVSTMAEAGHKWVRENGMIIHIAQKMLDILGVSG